MGVKLLATKTTEGVAIQARTQVFFGRPFVLRERPMPGTAVAYVDGEDVPIELEVDNAGRFTLPISPLESVLVAYVVPKVDAKNVVVQTGSGTVSDRQLTSVSSTDHALWISSATDGLI